MRHGDSISGNYLYICGMKNMENDFKTKKEKVVNEILTTAGLDDTDFTSEKRLVTLIQALVKSASEYAFDRGYDSGYVAALNETINTKDE